MTNDEELLAVLADIFDAAATKCPTKWHAAKAIVLMLDGAGYKITEK